jgi:superfamily I DNA/RNA helicase
MSRQIKLFGPPGTGKTRELSSLALKAVQHFGADRVMATTFTRAAANELKERIAQGCQLSLPADNWARRRMLEQTFPWIGTTHSLALKLIGRTPVVSGKDLTEFSKSLGGKALDLPDTDDLEGYAWSDASLRDDIQIALGLHASARHRLEPLSAAYLRVMPTLDIARIERITTAYEDYKHQIGKIDFEDMLMLGSHEYAPEVRVVLADEVQDNSPLLWMTVDQWAGGERDFVMAGDPYQAIYLFSGAQPELFIGHPGELKRLGDSHRLTQASAQQAQSVLKAAGYEEGEWLGTWSGVGSGDGYGSGDEFWLARTGRLLQDVTARFEEQGISYGYIRGGGPLETKAADAFRTWVKLRSGTPQTSSALAHLAQQIDRAYLAPGTPKRMNSMPPEALWDEEQVAQMWQMDLRKVPHAIKKGEYLARVFGREGIGAFIFGAPRRVGTIHSAKGREADTVHLITSWGTLPYQATLEAAGRAAEGCVAYVGVTRHRASLALEYVSEGTPYEFQFR